MTDDIMARPDGTGSRASTEPTSGLGPSGFDPSRGGARQSGEGIREDDARAYFERGFICCAAWAMTKPGDTLSDDVIEHAWAHRDEGMDEQDLLPALATVPTPEATRTSTPAS